MGSWRFILTSLLGRSGKNWPPPESFQVRIPGTCAYASFCSNGDFADVMNSKDSEMERSFCIYPDGPIVLPHILIMEIISQVWSESAVNMEEESESWT